MTHWESYREYQCRICQEHCINRFDESVTKARECRSCHSVPTLEDAPDTSEGEGEPAGPAAQRSEQPGPERERQSRSAPSRPAGSDPLRVDPEGRAHPPNPEGDGGNENSVTRATDSPAKPR